MKKNTIFTIILSGFLCVASLLSAQHSTFFDADDALGRGYVERPYLRYEAEPGMIHSYQGAFLTPTFDQRTIQSEASNQQALNLVNVGDFVQWKNSEAADGMVIRFSIPDGVNGGGTTGKLNLYVDDTFVQEIELNSRWAWQYFFAGNSSYAHNEPAPGRFPRMRFDEVRVKLENKIPQNATFKLEKADAGAGAYTIDFVELELIPARVEKPIGENVVEYSGDGSDLSNFISNNGGKTIYISEGEYDIPVRLRMNVNNTKLIGAGMWYTQLHFTASPTSNSRGIEANGSNVEVSGFYITTENERRYISYTSGATGKGFEGSFGTNSKISDVWVTHFECGAWIIGTDGLHISHSRFRSNYADGINLARGSKNAVIEHCSFRNNGDDDMASWSNGSGAFTENIIFQYNTSENNWRAGAVGFFGGKQNKALNIVIIDPIEDGVRVNDTYDGTSFSDEGYFEIRDISIYRAGGKAGTRGTVGNLWGNRTAAIYLAADAGKYDVRNFIFSDIDIYESKGNAIMLLGSSIGNVSMKNVTVDRAGVSDVGNSWEYYGVFFSATGYNNYFCIDFKNMGDIREYNSIPARGFIFNANCEENSVSVRVNQTVDLKCFIPENFAGNNMEFNIISGGGNVSVNTQGFVTGLNEGTSQVKVTDKSNAENFIIFTVIVKDVAVAGVSLSAETLTLVVGDRHTLVASVEPENATNKNVVWSSSNENIVSVSVAGILRARAVGTATITVTTVEGRFIKRCIVTVVNTNDITTTTSEDLSIFAYGNEIQITGYTDGEIISIYNLLGVKVFSQQLKGGGAKTIRGLRDGIYIVAAEKAQIRQKVMIKN